MHDLVPLLPPKTVDANDELPELDFENGIESNREETFMDYVIKLVI